MPFDGVPVKPSRYAEGYGETDNRFDDPDFGRHYDDENEPLDMEEDDVDRLPSRPRFADPIRSGHFASAQSIALAAERLHQICGYSRADMRACIRRLCKKEMDERGHFIPYTAVAARINWSQIA